VKEANLGNLEEGVIRKSERGDQNEKAAIDLPDPSK